jgi:hypothetical protein
MVRSMLVAADLEEMRGWEHTMPGYGFGHRRSGLSRETLRGRVSGDDRAMSLSGSRVSRVFNLQATGIHRGSPDSRRHPAAAGWGNRDAGETE